MTYPTSNPERTEQQRVVAITNTSLLSNGDKERIQYISSVQQSFDKKCNRKETAESTAILEAAYIWDEQIGKTASRDTKCSNVQRNGPGGGRRDSITGGTGGPTDINRPSGVLTDDYIGRPFIERIYETAGVQYSVSALELGTSGGTPITIEANNIDKENMRAVLVDPEGINPDVWVNDGKILDHTNGKIKFDGVYWNIQILMPPGQGRIMRLKLISVVYQLESVFSGKDLVGYKKPELLPLLSTITSPTDGCDTNQYESELLWAARIDQVSKKERETNPSLYRRACLKYFAITLKGDNFGNNTRSLQLWVELVGEKLMFPVFNGSNYQTDNSFSPDRGFAGCTSSFCFKHKHNELVVMGPEGYGKECILKLSVAGQQISVPFSFQAPEADYSEPNPYSANGDDITIHGQNFGGVASTAIVFIDGKECKAEREEHATWLREHPVKGLPYISCTAQQTMAGIANISVFVAGQQSRIIQVSSVQRAGVRSVCKSSTSETEVDIKTGQAQDYWGRIDPRRELCTECPDGSGCNTDETYDAPFATENFYIQKLDISGGRSSLFLEPVPGDRISKREKRDYERATENQTVSMRVCPPERLLDPVMDKALHIRFEQAVLNKRDFCLSVLPCKPAVACSGRNQCAEKYEGNLPRCLIARSTDTAAEVGAFLTPVVQLCNHSLQCGVSSADAAFKAKNSVSKSCANALTVVCQCPADWEFSKLKTTKDHTEVSNINVKSPVSVVQAADGTETWEEYDYDYEGSHSCLKRCIRTEEKLEELKLAGCLESMMQEHLSGLYPSYFNPEDSAGCVPHSYCVNSTGIKGPSCLADQDCDDGACQIFGECECEASPRCIECTAGKHYRRDGKCEECPKNMALVFIGFFVGLLVMAGGMYWLDRKDFNLAFISIPIDYFQVLALFSRADIRWPPELLEILYALRFFNFNIDVATPECLLVGIFTYEMKFFATLLILPAIIVLLLLTWGFHCCWQTVCMKRKIDKLYSSKLVGTFLLSVYFLFLSCTTRALEIFNCSPTDPDDGWTYTDFTDRKCDGGGLCRCGDPEHLPLQLAPYATIALIVYTLGFPLFLLWILRFGDRRNLIKEDQLLRAAGVGDTYESNNRAFYIRVMFHKMYYYYKPGKTYWLLYILIRKAGIATCGLIFRTNPGFMLAGVLLILFVCYMLQVKHQPYMSTSQRKLVLADHAIKVANQDSTHMAIAYSIAKGTSRVLSSSLHTL
jgi:hypothetical protein